MGNANLYAVLSGRFAARAEATAIETADGRTWTYARLDSATARYAAFFTALGVGPGERVAVQVDKSPEALCLYLATLRAGLAYLPLNPAYPPRELEYFLGDAEPSIVVCRPESHDVLAPIARAKGVAHLLTLGAAGEGTLAEQSAGAADRFDTLASSADDIAAILYTSGTTGRPKGAALSHSNLSSNAITLHRAWGFREDDVLLHALPLFHTHGLFVACHCSLLNATPMILLPRFDTDQVMARLPNATVFMGVPTFYTRLLAHPGFGREQTARMRVFISGSAPLLEQTFEAFRERTGHVILERYGMTECGMSTSNPLDGERRPGTVGRPLPGVNLRVVDEGGKTLPRGEIGAIEFAGPNVFKGYWRMPEKTAEEFTADGYFRSGDMGRIDEDGYVAIVGRNKDLIISGGFNVYPKEVELCIDQLEGVEESAVIGLPDADFGERVVAVVVPAGGGAPPDPTAIIGALKGMLANYKVPKQIEIVETLPRNAMGKVQKNVLRDRYAPG